MIDKLLGTDVKNTSATQASVTFADKSGLYTECIILANSSTSDKLSANQVLTDQGIFYMDDPNTSFELGNKYRVSIDGDKITQSFDKLKTVDRVTVDSTVDTTITFKVGKNTNTMTLPDKTTYYYQGAKQTYDNLKSILQPDSSIIFAKNDDSAGYEYAVIFDPNYSKPELALNVTSSTTRLGVIDFNGNPQILKDGDLIDKSKIVDKDVVYQVTDIWGTNKYILVLDKSVEGKITGILPNKLSPKTLQIDNVSYDFSSDMDFSKINNTPGTFKIDDEITAYLGYDGKIVDVLSVNNDDNAMFAFVLNYSYTTSTDLKNYGTVQNNVKLLFTDGTTQTYKTNIDPANLKGTLVKYTMVPDPTATDDTVAADQTVALEQLTYPTARDYTISKDENMLDSSYVTSSAKIFNLVSNNQGLDAEVNLVNWTDLPYGTMPAGRVLYINRVGAFQDVNVMVLNDIFDEGYKSAVVEKKDLKSGRGGVNYSYTMLIDGKEYVYTSTGIPGADPGAVLRVKMVNGAVSSVQDIENAANQAMQVQGIDTTRIKMNGIIYQFKDDVMIYYYDGSYTVEGVSYVDTTKLYGKVSIYLDQSPYGGGKVAVILIDE